MLLILAWVVVIVQQVLYLQDEIQHANRVAEAQEKCAKQIENWVEQQVQGKVKQGSLQSIEDIESTKACIARH